LLPDTFSCPRCKCHALYRTRRKGGLDWLMSFFGLRPVRCFTCSKGFYIRHSRIRELDRDHTDDEYFRSGPRKVA
jgi:hypothetical protein